MTTTSTIAQPIRTTYDDLAQHPQKARCTDPLQRFEVAAGDPS